MKSDVIIIYTDGSSRGNPGPGGWGSIVWWNGKVSELGGGEKRTTNNRMELTATIEGLSFVRDLGDEYTIHMRTDSSYVINGITKWVAGWVRNGWINSKKEEVLNRDLWEALAEVVSDLKLSGSKISWVYVAGHSGIPGNEQADRVATEFADQENTKLFSGTYTDYNVDLESLEVVATSPKQRKSPEAKAREKMKAFSYLSLVNGKLSRHETWADCERQVKGMKGAKYKKAVSADDEKAIMKEWGL
jgi:ribonuclease HI